MITCSFCDQRVKESAPVFHGLHGHICETCIEEAVQSLVRQRKAKLQALAEACDSGVSLTDA